MRVLIVDDEAPARERLSQLLAAVGDHNVLGEARNGREAVDLATSGRPDVVLMDIRMPGMDGLEAAARLSMLDEPPAVIFVTAYGEHALEAFETQAVDYVVKPVRRDRLADALNKARRLNRAQLKALSEAADQSTGREHILCRRRTGLELIPIEDVFYFQADNKYVTVCHREGEDLIEDSLKQLETQFGPRFVRIHRNALVAQPHLGGLEKSGNGQHYVNVRDTGTRLEVSRRHVAEVRRLLRQLGD